jgi:hypothetical protein
MRQTETNAGPFGPAFSAHVNSREVLALCAAKQKYSVLLEYAKASFERIKQRLRHL